MQKLIIVFCQIIAFSLSAQEIPYRELGAPPVSYTPGTVAARMVDALGFRFYWATEGLTQKDLDYRTHNDSRTTGETVEHIYELSFMILNATMKKINAPGQEPKADFKNMRIKTLENLKAASDILMKSSEAELLTYSILFKRGTETLELPFWNIINGPLADCIWHSGQIASARRITGNPFSENVNLLTGRVSPSAD